jgi:hypothetical protein
MSEIDDKILELQKLKWKEEKELRERRHKQYLVWLKNNKGKYFKKVGDGFVCFYKIVSSGEYPEIAEISLEGKDISLTDYDADCFVRYDLLVEVSEEELVKQVLILFEKIVKNNFKIKERVGG